MNTLETRLIYIDRRLNHTSAVAPPIFQTANFRGEHVDDLIADFDRALAC